jgi:5-methylcytosine-specific restriction endonuclease McrA
MGLDAAKRTRGRRGPNELAPPKRTTGRKLQAMRAQLFRANPLCVACEAQGRVTPATQRDHVIPLSEGGADDDSNTQALCEACHEVKSKAEAARGVRRWAEREGGVKVFGATDPGNRPV